MRNVKTCACYLGSLYTVTNVLPDLSYLIWSWCEPHRPQSQVQILSMDCNLGFHKYDHDMVSRETANGCAIPAPHKGSQGQPRLLRPRTPSDEFSWRACWYLSSSGRMGCQANIPKCSIYYQPLPSLIT
jgi:hypothetical protein